MILSTYGQPGWETFQGNRIKALDLLPTGFFHPLIAAGSSLKPKGALCNLYQNISLHSQHTCTALPTCLGITKKKMGRSSVAGLMCHTVSQQESPFRFDF